MVHPYIPRRRFLQGGSALLGGGVLATTARGAPVATRVGPNRTELENARPSGLTAPGAWAIQGNRSNVISVFAGPESIEPGMPLTLRFISTDPNHDGVTPDVQRVDVFRMGYYGGFGARLLVSTTHLKGYHKGFVVPPSPAPIVAASASSLPFGPDILDYSNAYSLTYPATSKWETGMYIACATDRYGAQVYAYFVVRPTAKTMAQYDVLVTLGFNTYQAYNYAGGNSLYGFNTGNNRACGVSHNRPLSEATFDPGEYNNMLRSEYAMTVWLEREGYAVAYMSDTDFEQQDYPQAPATALLAQFNARRTPRALLVGGHSEYWSANGYDAFMTARDTHNTHLMFLAGNSVYWRVHFENRVMYCMKESWRLDSASGRPPTSLWRSYPNNRPENQLLGVMHVCDDDVQQGNPSTLDPGTDDGAIGWEWDTVVANSTNPIPLTAGVDQPGEGIGPGGAYDRYDSQAGSAPYTDYDVGQHYLFANQIPQPGDERFLPDGQGPTLLGMKFRVQTSGQLISARYWRSPNETAPGYISLWNADTNQLITARVATAYGPKHGWWTAEFSGGLRLEAGTTYVIAVIVNTAYYGRSNLLDAAGQMYFPVEELAPSVLGEMPVQQLPGTTGANLGIEQSNVIEVLEGSQGGSVFDVYYADSQPAPGSVAPDRPYYFVDVGFVPDGTVPADSMASSTAIGWPSANGLARTFASGSIYWALALSPTVAGDLSDNRGANGAGIQAAVSRQLNTRMGILPGPK